MFLEDSTFEIMTLENDIIYESIHLDILKYSIMEDVYIEQGESSSKFKTFVNNIIEKIKKFFINAKEAIINFFTKKAVNDKLDDIEQSIKENPELGKRKVKIPNYKELDKLYEKTISDLEHRVEDSEKIMEKYKKERKRILIGAGLTTVSLATAIGIVKNIGKKTEERLNEKIKHDIDHSACKIYEAIERNLNYREESNQKWENLKHKIIEDTLNSNIQRLQDQNNSNIQQLRNHNHVLTMIVDDQCKDSKKLKDIDTRLNALETERKNNDLELQGKNFLNSYASIMCDEASDSVKEVKDIVSVVINNSKGE